MGRGGEGAKQANKQERKQVKKQISNHISNRLNDQTKYVNNKKANKYTIKQANK